MSHGEQHIRCKKRHKIRNTTRSMTGIADFGAKTAKLKQDWAGLSHALAVMGRWVTQKGQRQQGRPKNRWRNDLDAFVRDWPYAYIAHPKLRRFRGKAFAQH